MSKSKGRSVSDLKSIGSSKSFSKSKTFSTNICGSGSNDKSTSTDVGSIEGKSRDTGFQRTYEIPGIMPVTSICGWIRPLRGGFKEKKN